MSKTISKYRLGTLLGAGGMAEVYRATLVGAEGFSRPVAIKRVLVGMSDPALADMLKAEARIASLLAHPNVVSVLDFDRDDQGRFFLVMELVEGRDLRALEATGRLPVSIAVFIVSALLRALGYAHALEWQGTPMGIVHRDVSPHNVLVSWDGAVKLSDFGIAKAAANTQVTRSGVVKGKVAYLSPEQALAEELDGRSDLFAAGIILHELLTGRRLFGVKEGAPEIVIMRRVLELPIEAPNAIVPEISPALSAVCLKLLERDRKRRYQTAEEALEALLACPEVSARGELELARLMAQRFPGQAPAAVRTFAKTTTNTPSLPATSPAAMTAPTPSSDRRLPDRPFGGFTLVDLESEGVRPEPPVREVKKSGPTLVEPKTTEPQPTHRLEVDGAGPAITATYREGAPDATWPARGDATLERGGATRTKPVGDTGRSLPATPAASGRSQQLLVGLAAVMVVMLGLVAVKLLGANGPTTRAITEPATPVIDPKPARDPVVANGGLAKVEVATATRTSAAAIEPAREPPREAEPSAPVEADKPKARLEKAAAEPASKTATRKVATKTRDARTERPAPKDGAKDAAKSAASATEAVKTAPAEKKDDDRVLIPNLEKVDSDRVLKPKF